MAHMIQCKNCDHSYEGKYCPMCRQPADTDRITWHEIGHHVQHALFHADRGLIYTIKELFKRPGRTLREYLDGKRVKHFNPFLFLILAGALASFLFYSLHLRPPVREISLEKLEHLSQTIAHKYFALVGLVFLVLLTLSDYLVYRKSKLLLTELIITNTFQAAQIMVITVAFIPLLLVQENWTAGADPIFDIRTIVKVAVLIYLFIVRYQLYEAGGKPALSARIALHLTLLVLLYEFVISKGVMTLIS